MGERWSVQPGKKILECPDVVVVRLCNAEHNLLAVRTYRWVLEPAPDRDAHLLQITSTRAHSPQQPVVSDDHERLTVRGPCEGVVAMAAHPHRVAMDLARRTTCRRT